MGRFTIRQRIYGLILIVLIPLVFLQCRGIIEQYELNVESEINSSEEYARAISSSFMNFVYKIWDSELAIGSAIADNPSMSVEQMEAYMETIASGQPAIKRYSWIGPDLKVIACTLESREDIYLDDRDHIRQIINGKEKSISDLIIGKMDLELVVPISRGIYMNGKLAGIVSAAVDIEQLGLVMPVYSKTRAGSFGIIDKSGRIVYTSADPSISYEKRRIDDGSMAMMALKSRVPVMGKDIAGFDGSKSVGAYIPIQEIGWECFSIVSSKELSPVHDNDINMHLFTLVFVIVVFLVMAFVLGNSIIRPAERLKAAARTIFEGDLSVRTDIKGNDELAEAGKAFDKMAERIQQLEVSRDLFLRTSVHELRNPITSIKGISSLICMKLSLGKSPDNLMDMVELMGKETDRLSEILNEMIEGFRTSSHVAEMKLNLETIDIAEVITSALKSFYTIEGNGKFIFENKGPIWIQGDFQRLEIVMRNIFGNAVKYSPDGGEIRVDINASGEFATISVKDSGIGIPEKYLEKIFESFYRVRNMKGKDPGGMGLGLYICRDIVRKHGGSIWAENNKDKGSTFYIKIPLYRGDKDAENTDN